MGITTASPHFSPLLSLPPFVMRLLGLTFLSLFSVAAFAQQQGMLAVEIVCEMAVLSDEKLFWGGWSDRGPRRCLVKQAKNIKTMAVCLCLGRLLIPWTRNLTWEK